MPTTLKACFGNSAILWQYERFPYLCVNTTDPLSLSSSLFRSVAFSTGHVESEPHKSNMYISIARACWLEIWISNSCVILISNLALNFRHMAGIPMGTNCAPLLADLFLYSYENAFLDKLIKDGKRKLARKFNLWYRYIDDLISISNKIFKEFILILTPKNSQFLKPQNLTQLLLISICFSPEIRATT